MDKNSFFQIKNLRKYYRIDKDSIIKAVDNVSFDIRQGETISLVGESGCGKTSLARTILNVYKPTYGQVLFKGRDVHKMRGREKKDFKKNAQLIFQDSYSSLNPRMTVEKIVEEGMRVHLKNNPEERKKQVLELLEKVALNEEHMRRFPHELSSGQRQRVGIARALAIEPKFIICDEPISALDISIQAQVINLLIDLQKQLSLTYLFISHDLSMVRHISDRVAVMYLGSIIELAPSEEIYQKPLHPYTQALISSIPIPDPKLEMMRESMRLPGEVPSIINPLAGCKFRERCSYATDKCGEAEPRLVEIEKDHFVACYMV